MIVLAVIGAALFVVFGPRWLGGLIAVVIAALAVGVGLAVYLVAIAAAGAGH